MSSSLFNTNATRLYDLAPKAQATGSVLDTGSLDSLRQKAFGEDKEKALREAAQQFEAIFLNMVMSSMRKANDVFAEDNPLNSRYTSMYRDMYDQQLTSELSNKGALGLADLMVQQLSPSKGKEQFQRNGGDLGEKRMHSPSKTLSEQGGLPVGLYYGETRVNKVKAGDEVIKFTSPESFVEAIRPSIEKFAAAEGINPDVLIAQAALETGWGQRLIPGQSGGSSNNLFNIKADTRWQGKQSHVSTVEFDGNVAKREKAAFRSYDTLEHSIKDYLSFIQDSPRYQHAMKHAGNAKQFAIELQNAGYATDPSYAQKVAQIVQKVQAMQGTQDLQSAERYQPPLSE